MIDPNKQLTVRGHYIAAAVLMVIAVAWTGFPMLAITVGIPVRSSGRNSNDIGGYFLASVACVLIAIWIAGRTALRQWRSRKK